MKCKLKGSFAENPAAALCVYTTLPHSSTTYRILYYDLKSAVPTLEPDFRQFNLDTFDLGLGEGEELSPIIFVLRDVSAVSKHEVGSELGYMRTSISKLSESLLVQSKGEEELAPEIDFYLNPTRPLLHFNTDSNGVTTLLETPTQHEVTYLSIVQNTVQNFVCAAGNPIFYEAAKIHRKNVIDLLYRRTQPCSNKRCPHFGQAKKCLNLESQGLYDQDLQEIMM